jgi:hypothetical protein
MKQELVRVGNTGTPVVRRALTPAQFGDLAKVLLETSKPVTIIYKLNKWRRSTIGSRCLWKRTAESRYRIASAIVHVVLAKRVWTAF